MELPPGLLRYVEPATDGSGCLNWTGGVNDDGYGYVYLDGKQVRAHRLTYWFAHGALPAGGLVLDHRCENRRCVNVLHLEPKSTGANARAGSAHNARKTACPKGHPYNAENTKVNAKGWRSCRTCNGWQASPYR